MNGDFEAYVSIAFGLFMLAIWMKAWLDGTTTELFIADENEARKGDKDFEVAQRYRLILAGVAFALGIYGLIFGLD